MFSGGETPRLLMDFGLAFRRNDDPQAFAKLKKITKKVRVYGEPAGRISRFLGFLERYPHSVPFIFTTLIILVTIIYYVLYGEKLPIG